MLHPIECDDLQAKVFKLMGYVIVEVDGDTAKRLVNAARDAMLHQLEVAAITEEAIKKGKP